MSGKQAGYHALAEFYQSLVCKTQKQVGMEIARLEVSNIGVNGTVVALLIVIAHITIISKILKNSIL